MECVGNKSRHHRPHLVKGQTRFLSRLGNSWEGGHLALEPEPGAPLSSWHARRSQFALEVVFVPVKTQGGGNPLLVFYSGRHGLGWPFPLTSTSHHISDGSCVRMLRPPSEGSDLLERPHLFERKRIMAHRTIREQRLPKGPECPVAAFKPIGDAMRCSTSKGHYRTAHHHLVVLSDRGIGSSVGCALNARLLAGLVHLRGTHHSIEATAQTGSAGLTPIPGRPRGRLGSLLEKAQVGCGTGREWSFEADDMLRAERA